jgi:hypothetical protein
MGPQMCERGHSVPEASKMSKSAGDSVVADMAHIHDGHNEYGAGFRRPKCADVDVYQSIGTLKKYCETKSASLVDASVHARHRRSGRLLSQTLVVA